MAEAPAEFETKVLIMCGGKGTRMWPISNLNHPKQFESLLGNQSMFRQTVERVLTGFKPEDIYIATSESFGEHLIKQAPEVPETNFVLEPAMRDNLGAVGLATAWPLWGRLKPGIAHPAAYSPVATRSLRCR